MIFEQILLIDKCLFADNECRLDQYFENWMWRYSCCAGAVGCVDVESFADMVGSNSLGIAATTTNRRKLGFLYSIFTTPQIANLQ
jgi:hypothetical protein